MPPPSYPAQISAVTDRSSPSLSARAALDAYAANPHLRSSPTFEFLHFAVLGKYKVPNEMCEEEGDDSAFDVSLLGLGPHDDDSQEYLRDWTSDARWEVIDVDLEDANGAPTRSSART